MYEVLRKPSVEDLKARLVMWGCRFKVCDLSIVEFNIPVNVFRNYYIYDNHVIHTLNILLKYIGHIFKIVSHLGSYGNVRVSHKNS